MFSWIFSLFHLIIIQVNFRNNYSLLKKWIELRNLYSNCLKFLFCLFDNFSYEIIIKCQMLYLNQKYLWHLVLLFWLVEWWWWWWWWVVESWKTLENSFFFWKSEVKVKLNWIKNFVVAVFFHFNFGSSVNKTIFLLNSVAQSFYLIIQLLDDDEIVCVIA